MKKIILLMVLIITIACSQYSSYDDCYVSEMSKMPNGLSNKPTFGRMYSPQAEFLSSVETLCKEQFPD